MKVLITGGSGLLGQYLNIELSKNYEMLTTYNKNKGNCENYYCKELDITDVERLEETFSEFNPECVIHLGAISRPLDCEKAGKEKVLEVNVEATKKIAQLCHKYSSKLILFAWANTVLRPTAKIGKARVKNSFFMLTILLI